MTDEIRNDDNADDDLLDRSLSAMRNAPIPDGPSERVVADTLAALRGAAGLNERPITLFSRIKNMKPITRMAASVLLAAGLTFLAVLTLRPNSPAWADVIDRVATAKALSFNATTTIPTSDKPLSMRFLMTSIARSTAPLASSGGSLLASTSSTRCMPPWRSSPSGIAFSRSFAVGVSLDGAIRSACGNW